jgi:hypothetical protein
LRALRRLRKLRGAESLSLVGVFFLSVSTTDDDDDDTDDDTDDDDYAARSCPSSYDQSSGNGQSLSRRYCTQWVWLNRFELLSFLLLLQKKTRRAFDTTS